MIHGDSCSLLENHICCIVSEKKLSYKIKQTLTNPLETKKMRREKSNNLLKTVFHIKSDSSAILNLYPVVW